MLKFRKIFITIKVIINITAVFILGNCTSSEKHSNHILKSIEKEEIILQKKILIQEMVLATNRIQNIGWAMLHNNATSCKKKSNYSYGITYVDKNDLPQVDHHIYRDLFNKDINKKIFKEFKVDSFPKVISVAKESPAHVGNVLRNDIILKINNETPRDFRKKLHSSLSKSSILKIKVLRKNNILDLILKGKKICNYNIQVLPSGYPNAFADGTKIFITMAAIKLARTDDELAFLIGHELAHNIYDYNSKETSEAFTFVINYKDRPKIREIKNLFVWSSEQKEIRADIEAVKLSYKAGFNLENINDYWRRLSVFNPELIEKSEHIYMGNAYRAALIQKTISEIKKEKK